MKSTQTESQLDAIQHIIIDEWAQNIALTAELKANFAKLPF